MLFSNLCNFCAFLNRDNVGGGYLDLKKKKKKSKRKVAKEKGIKKKKKERQQQLLTRARERKGINSLLFLARFFTSKMRGSIPKFREKKEEKGKEK